MSFEEEFYDVGAGSQSKRIKDRPFVRYYLSRQIRKLFGVRSRLGQIPETEYDQLIAKCHSTNCMAAMCDLADNDEDFSFKSLNMWLIKNLDVLKNLAGEFEDVSLTQPEMYHNVGPKMRGRKAIRAAGPKYQTDEAFLADKEAFQREMHEEV